MLPLEGDWGGENMLYETTCTSEPANMAPTEVSGLYMPLLAILSASRCLWLFIAGSIHTLLTPCDPLSMSSGTPAWLMWGLSPSRTHLHPLPGAVMGIALQCWHQLCSTTSAWIVRMLCSIVLLSGLHSMPHCPANRPKLHSMFT